MNCYQVLLFWFLCLIHDTRSEFCFWEETVRCGETCVGKDNSDCVCGNQTISPMTKDQTCCTGHDGCFKVKKSLGLYHDNLVAKCPNGSVQAKNSYCPQSNECLTSTTQECSMPCKYSNGEISCTEITDCNKFCRGASICPENKWLEQKYCATQHKCLSYLLYTCPQVPGAKYQHHECPKEDIYLSHDHFHCLNRMDKADHMFKKSLFRHKSRSPNLSNELFFDNTSFRCSDFINIEWKFTDLYRQVGHVNGCYLKDGSFIERPKLFHLLLKDLSFTGRHFIPGDWLLFHDQFRACSSDWSGNVPCDSHPTICTFDDEVCDGIPQCPEATDESFDKCRANFPPSATIPCTKGGIGNGFLIPILAIPCNGVTECKDGSDEMNCGSNQSFFVIALVAGTFIIILLSVTIVSFTEVNESNKEIDFDKVLVEENTLEVRNIIIELQKTKNRPSYNLAYFKMVLNLFDGHHTSALNYAKETLGPSVIKNLLHDLKLSTSSFRLHQLMLRKIVMSISYRVYFGTRIIIKLLSCYFDIIRDVFFIATIGQLVHGGEFFLRWVSYHQIHSSKHSKLSLISDILVFSWMSSCTILFGITEPYIQHIVGIESWFYM